MAINAAGMAEETQFCGGDVGYRGIVEHINEGVVIIREGRIAFANKAFYGICRRTPEDILGLEFYELVSPSDRKGVTAFFAERINSAGLPDRIDFTMLRPEKDVIIEMKVNVIICAGAPAILGALTDVTERRTTRHELLKVKDRLESIIQSIYDVVVSMSHVDQTILAINPSAEALYGIPTRDFSSGKRHVMDFVYPGDLEIVKQFYASLPELEFADLSYRIVSHNKTIKWVLDEGRVVYAEGGRVRRVDHIIRDITDEKMALDALKQSEEKYRSFFESTHDMAFAVTPDGTFLDINEAGIKLLGFKNREEALSTNIRDTYVDPCERKSLIAELREKGYIVDKRVRLKNTAGEVFEIAVTARAKLNEAGELLYHEGLAHNITQALQDQRNRVLRNAAGGLCHYLNTHLASLLLSQEIIDEDIKCLEELARSPAGGRSPGDVFKELRDTLVSLRESHDGLVSAYERITKVTNAFNSAFLTYEEEAYLDRTILDIFNMYSKKENPE